MLRQAAKAIVVEMEYAGIFVGLLLLTAILYSRSRHDGPPPDDDDEEDEE